MDFLLFHLFWPYNRFSNRLTFVYKGEKNSTLFNECFAILFNKKNEFLDFSMEVLSNRKKINDVSNLEFYEFFIEF